MKSFLNTTLLILLLAGIGLFPKQGKSQILFDAVAGSIVGIPDTVDMGDTVDFAYQVVNQGPIPFVGIMLTNLMVNGNVISGAIGNFPISLLGVNDTAYVMVPNYTFTTQRHQGGGNVMVIWPTGTGGQQTDSLQRDVYVREPVAIEDGQLSSPIQAYPNPTHHRLRLSAVEDPDKPQKLTILQADGRILSEENLERTGETEIDLSEYPAGLYYLSVQYQSGKTSTIKIIKL